ncbi:hypothetical protein AB0M44_46820, partial [Streptosporangium subroseum]|uniref:hypothetical protein n=1 Tax=Streptosporangium subroseum TaxID=106412 RepID=UPI0034153F31
MPARERFSAWLLVRAELLTARPALAEAVGDGLWVSQRGRLAVDGVTDAVRAVGKAADLPGLRSHRLRHTYATRLRVVGAARRRSSGVNPRGFSAVAISTVAPDPRRDAS